MATTTRRNNGRGTAKPSVPTGPSRSSASRQSSNAVSSPLDDTDEIKKLRSKYSDKLGNLTMLFKSWSEEDLLYALQDADGDLNLAIDRVSSGQTEKWDAVPPKGTKKESSAEKPAISSTIDTSNGSFGRGVDRGASSRGGRGGRGGPRGARGGRGGGRGVRGGRGGGVDRSIPRSTQEDSSAANGAVDTGPLNETSVPTGSWADTAVDDDWEVTPPSQPTKQESAAHDNFGEDTNKTTTTKQTANSSDASASVPFTGQSANLTQTKPAIPTGPKASVSRPAKPAAAKTVGKMSWAQIAKPPSPPPVVENVAPPEEPVRSAKNDDKVDPETQPQVTHIENTVSEQEQPWNGATTTGSWEAASARNPQALGVGEGWADSVLAADKKTRTESTVDGNAIPPPGINPAGPIDVSVPEQEPPLSLREQQAAPAPVQEVKKENRVMTPPGLSKRYGQRNHQNSPVVMPTERGIMGGVDRTGVQFGSLSLYDPGEAAQGQHRPQPLAPVSDERKPDLGPTPHRATAVNGAVPSPTPSSYDQYRAHHGQGSTQQHSVSRPQAPSTASGPSPRNAFDERQQVQDDHRLESALSNQQQQQHFMGGMQGMQQPVTQDAFPPTQSYMFQQQHQPPFAAPQQQPQSSAVSSMGLSQPSYAPYVQGQLPGFQGQEFAQHYGNATENALRNLELSQNPHDAYARQNQPTPGGRFSHSQEDHSKDPHQLVQEQGTENQQTGQPQLQRSQPPHQQHQMPPYGHHAAAPGFMPYYYGQPAYNPAGYPPSWPPHYNQTAIPPSYYPRGRVDAYPPPHQPSPQNTAAPQPFRQAAPEQIPRQQAAPPQLQHQQGQPPQPPTGQHNSQLAFQAASQAPQRHHGASQHDQQQPSQPPYAGYPPNPTAAQQAALYGGYAEYGGGFDPQDRFGSGPHQHPQQQHAQHAGGGLKGDVNRWME